MTINKVYKTIHYILRMKSEKGILGKIGLSLSSGTAGTIVAHSLLCGSPACPGIPALAALVSYPITQAYRDDIVNSRFGYLMKSEEGIDYSSLTGTRQMMLRGQFPELTSRAEAYADNVAIGVGVATAAMTFSVGLATIYAFKRRRRTNGACCRE